MVGLGDAPLWRQRWAGWCNELTPSPFVSSPRARSRPPAGKTLQTISLLGYLQEALGNQGPHLILVPKSTLS